MDTAIRPEAPTDAAQVHDVVRSAFGRDDEAILVASLRSLPGVLSFVAVAGPRVIGHVMFSPIMLPCAESPAAARGLAPVAVVPDLRRQGVGSGLIRFGLAELERNGVDVVFVLGDPDFYGRFGFVPAHAVGLRSRWGGQDGAFLVLELAEGALGGCRGTVEYLPVFDEFVG
jgi:putative acetyltransferase